MHSNHFMEHTALSFVPPFITFKGRHVTVQSAPLSYKGSKAVTHAEQKRFCSSEVLNRRSLLQTHFPQDIFPFHPNPICCNKFNPQHFIIVCKKRKGGLKLYWKLQAGWPKITLQGQQIQVALAVYPHQTRFNCF